MSNHTDIIPIPIPISAFFNHTDTDTDIRISFHTDTDTDIRIFVIPIPIPKIHTDTDTRYRYFLLVSVSGIGINIGIGGTLIRILHLSPGMNSFLHGSSTRMNTSCLGLHLPDSSTHAAQVILRRVYLGPRGALTSLSRRSKCWEP